MYAIDKMETALKKASLPEDYAVTMKHPILSLILRISLIGRITPPLPVLSHILSLIERIFLIDGITPQLPVLSQILSLI